MEKLGVEVRKGATVTRTTTALLRASMPRQQTRNWIRTDTPTSLTGEERDGETTVP